MKKIFKPIKDDPENPFGSLIKDKAIDEKKLGLIYKTRDRDEGDWDEWPEDLLEKTVMEGNRE